MNNTLGNVSVRIRDIKGDAETRRRAAEKAMNAAIQSRLEHVELREKASKDMDIQEYNRIIQLLREDGETIDMLHNVIKSSTEEPLINENDYKALCKTVTDALDHEWKEDNKKLLKLLKEAVSIAEDYRANVLYGNDLMHCLQYDLYKEPFKRKKENGTEVVRVNKEYRPVRNTDLYTVVKRIADNEAVKEMKRAAEE